MIDCNHTLDRRIDQVIHLSVFLPDMSLDPAPVASDVSGYALPLIEASSKWSRRAAGSPSL